MTVQKSNMYPETKTWNPFVGCRFDCVYCEPSFKRMLKRVAGRIKCPSCYTYEPHYHAERLNRIPSAPNVFVAGTGDIAFCTPEFMKRIFKAIEDHKPRMKKTYFFQTKNPFIFHLYHDWFQANQDKVVLITTLETNRDTRGISKALHPLNRFTDFYEVDYPRKVITVEPVLDFDLYPFLRWFLEFRNQGSLEYVWYGFDSKNCGLPEPSTRKAQKFVNELQELGIEVRGKSVRDVIV